MNDGSSFIRMNRRSSEMLQQAMGVFVIVASVGLGSSSDATGSLVPIQNNVSQEKAKHVKVQEIIGESTKLVLATAEVLNPIKDEKTAGTAAEQLKRNAQKTQEIADKLRKVGQLTREDNDRLSSKAFEEAAKSHAQANRKLRAFLEKGTLPKAAETAIGEALLEWSAANFTYSQAMLSILPPPKKGKTP
jgi:hypothetical protein